VFLSFAQIPYAEFPKFSLNRPIMPKIPSKWLKFLAYAGNVLIADYAKSSAGIFRMALRGGGEEAARSTRGRRRRCRR